MPRFSANEFAFEEFDLTRGVNLRDMPDRIQKGEILYSKNMQLIGDHLLQVRGYAKKGKNIAFTHDGSADYFKITNGSQTNLHQTGSFSVEVLIKTPGAFSGDGTIIARWTGTTATSQYRLRLDSTGDAILEVSNGSAEELIRTVTPLTISTVYILKASWHATNGLTLKVYTDATTVQETVTGSTSLVSLNSSTTPDTTIGAEHGGSDFYTGEISYARYQDEEDTGVTSFDGGTDVQGLWRATLDGTPLLVDFTANNNDMSPVSLTDSDRTSFGPIVPVLFNIPISMSTFKNSSGGNETVALTLDRFYQYSSTLDAFVDVTGLVNLDGILTSRPTGDYWAKDNIFVMTNREINPKKHDLVTKSVSNLSSSLGSSYKALIFRAFDFRGHLFNIIDGANNFFWRHQWSAVNDISSGSGDWDISGTGDFVDLTDTPGPIIQAWPLNNFMVVFKERGAIINMSKSGRVEVPYQYRTVVEADEHADDSGLIAAASVATVTLPDGSTSLMYLSSRNIHMYNGRTSIPVGNKISQALEDINPEAIGNAWAFTDATTGKYTLYIPTEDATYPAVAWQYYPVTGAWIGPIEIPVGMTTYGLFRVSSSLEWDELGDLTWDEADWIWNFETVTSAIPNLLYADSSGFVYLSNALTTLFDEAAITSNIIYREFRMKDPKTGRFRTTRWKSVEAEISALAATDLQMSYSTDHGFTWSTPTSPINNVFDGTTKRYFWPLDMVSDTLRVRLQKTAINSTWKNPWVIVRGIPLEFTL